MKRTVLKSKIHRATLTRTELQYAGSITLDPELLTAADMLPYEKVQVLNLHTGARLETYTIAGARGSGEICVNGAAAHLIGVSEEIIVMGFELTAVPLEPNVILVTSEDNRQFSRLHEKAGMTV